MTREKVLELVTKLILMEGTEREIHDMIYLLNTKGPCPFGSDYIFNKDYDGLSTEEIVDKIFKYKPIKL